jgi:hypothetical protein
MKALLFSFLTLFYLQQCEAQKAVPPKFNEPTAVVNNQNEGMLYKPYLLKAKKIDVISDNYKKENFVVTNFSVVIMRNNDTVFAMKNIQGNSFSDELKNAFKSIGHGSKLIFYGIKAQRSDKRILELSPLEFTITKK